MSQTVGFIYAHPDDETFLSACLIRQLADQGHRPVLLLATKGDAGKKNGYLSHLSNEELAEVRVKEMEKAAEILGLSVVEHLGFPDGKSNTVDEKIFIDGIVNFVNTYEPSMLFTFPADGGNFHPDHMTISKMTTAAVLSGRCPSVNKLYYSMSNTLMEEGYKPSIVIDTEEQWPMKADALKAHMSQIFAIERHFGKLDSVPENRRYESFVLAWEKGRMDHAGFVEGRL
ncbi:MULTISPECIES: PIG-L family deacetylase [unclassified Paenibacillus]|uniref:PIG-L deacetylase family protein n=1 Tax=unclassified Paenibacillus TaxID=185978 RepID=UPI001AEA984A|nr:LmbE family N-acetylglucosaminyl deacetylase [Paenibacillus sp. PvP091]MBP1169616.1 LmbE family N-acetylglucosaminyl deacetylase [Paenibacillus sp. PvR098]MBP2440644.1 LmbE family N-acetylglucosaminyl deacetylase [Paenibacillus sp. PvP052]